MKTIQELVNESERQLFHIFATIGFDNTVKLMANMAQEFGDSKQYKDVLPQWLSIAAIMEEAHIKIIDVKQES